MKQKTIAQPAHDRETADRLLDTAERLFGEQGYDGVGIRELATEANVNLGAATYHFGSKKALYLETFMRRFRPTNAERLRLLRKAEAEAKSKPLTVEKIVDCVVRPPYLLGLEHPNFHALMARSLFMPPPFLHAAIHKELAPNVEVFIAAFRRSLPDVPEDLLHLRTMFAMGALLMFSVQRGKMRFPQNSKFDDSLLRELIRFISAGLQSEPAVVGSERPSIPLPPRPPRR
jgi:AcrR family transcriptional regulator